MTAADLLAAAELAPLDALQRAAPGTPEGRGRLRPPPRQRRRAAAARSRRSGSPPSTRSPPATPTSKRSRRRCSRGAWASPRPPARWPRRRGRRRPRPTRRGPPTCCSTRWPLRLSDGYVAAAPALAAALRACLERDDGRWLWLACRLAQDLWDDELWHDLAARGVRLGRETGALRSLALASIYHAAFSVHTGEFAAAQAQIEDSDGDHPSGRNRTVALPGDDAGRLARRPPQVAGDVRELARRGQRTRRGHGPRGHRLDAGAAPERPRPARHGARGGPIRVRARRRRDVLVVAAGADRGRRARGSPRRGRGGLRAALRACPGERHRVGARGRGRVPGLSCTTTRPPTARRSIA